MATLRHLSAILGVGLLIATGSVFAVDWEEALAAHHRARTEAQRVADWAAAQNPPAEAVKKRWDFVRRQYPDSADAANIDVQRLADLVRAERWDEVVDAAPEAIRRVANYPVKAAAITAFLGRAAANPKLTAEVRLKAVRGLVPVAENKSFSVGICQNFLLSGPPGMGAADVIALAVALEERSGMGPKMREFRWRIIERYSASLPADAAREAMEAFVRRYGMTHPEGRAAMVWLAQREGTEEGKARVVEILRTDREQAALVAAALKSLRAAVAGGDLEVVRGVLASGISFPSREMGDGLWAALLGGKEFAAADKAVKREVMLACLKHTVAGQAQEMVMQGILHQFRTDAGLIKAIIPVLEANMTDIQRASTHLTMLTRCVREIGDDALLREMGSVAVLVTEKLGMNDAAVDYLTEFGEAVWDTDLEAAKAAFRRAASYWPKIPAAAEAGWVLEFLEGRNGLVQGALPRQRRSIPGPELLAMRPVSVEAGVKEAAVRGKEGPDGVWTPEVNDVGRNLLRGCSATDGSGRTHLEATDGEARTAWVPEKLPAALRVDVGVGVSVARVVVRLVEPADFVVTLRDARGKALRRMERDWGFWEQFRTAQHWSGTEETLNILPVDGVRFVEVQVLGSNGEGGVSEIECYSPAYPVTFVREGRTTDLPAGSRSVLVELEPVTAAHVRTIQADREYTRGYPIHRWAAPWMRSKGPLVLRSVQEHLGVEFFGRRAELILSGSGGIEWMFEDGVRGEEAAVKAEGKESRVLAFPELKGGRHLLRIGETRMPASKNFGGWADMRFVGLRVEGEVSARAVVRFIGESGATTEWMSAGGGEALRIPGSVGKERVRAVQAGTLFDHRESGGERCVSAREPRLKVSGTEGVVEAGPALVEDVPLREEMEAVVSAMARRDAVVVYPKRGSDAEYSIAKRIAERAGLALMPDDIGLNRYSVPVLAVGTPLRHRYCRQLIAMAGVWNGPAFLNDADGVLAVERDERGQELNFHVTGETPEAVVAAGERLLARMQQHVPATPFRVVQAEGLEVVYPWQLHGSRAEPKLEVTVGRNDRRSVQFGLVAEEDLKEIRVECGPLRDASGKEGGRVLVRRVGNYEWVPFFGDLRLPNHLLPVERFDLPKRSGAGVWITVETSADMAAGEHRAEVRITAAGVSKTVPLVVKVVPVLLPASTDVTTMSFAFVPYWFHAGSGPWRSAVESLAADEADQGVNALTPAMRYSWSLGKTTRPVEVGVGSRDEAPGRLGWRKLDGEESKADKGQGIFLRFARDVSVRELATVLRPSERTAFGLAVWREGGWVEVGGVSRSLSPSFEAHRRKVEAGPEVIRWRLGSGAEGVRGTEWRISSREDVAFVQRGAVAVGEGDDRFPVMFGFAALEEEMGLMEKVYAKRGLPLPTFLCQMTVAGILQATAEAMGTTQMKEGDVGTWFSEQLLERLKATGRDRRFILKVGDEPSNLEMWAQSAQPYKQGGLRIMTCHNASYPDMNVGAGLLDPWCPNYEHEVWKPFFGERRGKGEAVWWYECGVPATRLTGTPSDNLPFYWLTAKWNMDGAMNYAALHAVKGSSMPVMFRFEHGMDHRLTVDASGRITPTMRREWEGDGIRDLRLIEWIRKAAGRLAGRDAAKAEAVNRRLDAVIESVVPYRLGYCQNPKGWVEARETLYGLAVEAAGPF